MKKNLTIISAGAGSGKTYRLTSEMVELLKGGVRASGIIATTFTKKAAAELQERVRVRLLEEGMTEQANDLTNALIGTVHGLGVKLLQRFAYEAGVSPEVSIIADEDGQLLFNQSLATVLTNERVERMEQLSDKLGMNKKGWEDWRKTVRHLVDVARANDFSVEILEQSKVRSFESFAGFMSEKSDRPNAWWKKELQDHIEDAIAAVDANPDETKTTATAINYLKGVLRDLRLRGDLYWYEWVKISKLKIGAKSRDDVADLVDFASKCDQHPDFHTDVKAYIDLVFDLAIAAIKEYANYKKKRGLIDYTDMEVLVKELLNNAQVEAVLKEELDLLMVDEFQDTSPIQLEIFWKLAGFAKHSVWVGDPKQSIYGFRGADPKMMKALIQQQGGIDEKNIQEYSWRSREDVVAATNALFTKAFDDLPEEQVALKPKRCKIATAGSKNKENEHDNAGLAIHHWHFEPEDGGRTPSKAWLNDSIANAVQEVLDGEIWIQPKDENDWRPALAGDVAVLCRSNGACQAMAESLHKAGLKAAISRAGLLQTAEAKLILACLQFILNKYDSLSLAEILLLAGRLSLEEIIEDRIDYLEKKEANEADYKWAENHEFIGRLNQLRTEVVELSSAEILNLLLEELDLRRLIVAWGKVEQRLANVDEICRLALQYEDNCNRLHTAASLGGFLLWLNDLAGKEQDMQGSGEAADTVRVMTYHKSKGLEFPVTICHSLEQTLRDNVFGINIVAEEEEVDMENILANRWVRFWVNPYADQFRNTPLVERINASNVKEAALKEALEEEARLLYVGITRARDYIVFPTRGKQPIWLNRVFHKGKEDYPTLDAMSSETQWVWKDEILLKETKVFQNPRSFPTADLPLEHILFLEERVGRDAYAPYHIDLTIETFEDDFAAKTQGTSNYATPLILEEDEDTYAVGKCFKAFLTADRLTYGATIRHAMATDLIQRFELTEVLNAPKLLQQSEAFFKHLKANYNIKKVWRKFPISLTHKERLFETLIDLLLETDEGFIIIQNTAFSGEAKKWAEHSLRLGSWYFLTARAIRTIFDAPVVNGLVHFALGGGVMKLEIKEAIRV